MMQLQLSAGQGPLECELAVGKLLEALLAEYPQIDVLEKVRGEKSGSYKSVLLAAPMDLSHLEGTIQWICPSPYRPKHKRKNWFVDVSLTEEVETLAYDQDLVRFETFRSGGKGGQHVNKVETGVRGIYLPTGLVVVSTEARSQHLNKQIVLDRLCAMIAAQNAEDQNQLRSYRRLEHLRLERGNPKRVYEGLDFKRIK